MKLLEIKGKVQKKLEVRKSLVPFSDLEKQVRPTLKTDLLKTFPKNEINIIAEIKKASPSEGDIALQIDPLAVAKDYIDNGAKALSVLTEPDYFKGDLNYLKNIRQQNSDAFLLMKDFIFDEYQILEGLLAGASAILLIVAMLEKRQIKTLLDRALSWNLSPLVEVHSEDELKLALEIGAKFIGVNNRNLNSMVVTLETSEKLARYSSRCDVFVSESGLQTGSQIKRLNEMGYSAFLMGTHFMKAPSPGAALRKVIEDARD